MSETAGIPGQQGLTDANSAFNQHAFQIEQMMARGAKVRLVKVMKVKLPGANGDVAQAGSINVMPLTNQIDGQGNATPHGTAFNLPYSRMQSGNSAIIMDPVAGDMGVIVICDNDISANKSKRGQANPGSFRRGSMSDGIYVGSILNSAPAQWLRFFDDGLELADKHGNKIKTSSIGVAVTPGAGFVYLGGDGMAGTYDFVQTVTAPSINVKARTG